jgi:N-sulfoglucosamine sulfohydrolase
VLRALRESGLAENTLTMFLSDNGIALPFAKTNCYLHSTRTPWIARWPGKIKPGTVDNRHFISGIDFMPTVLDAAGLKAPRGMDGSSFLPVLTGHKQAGRERVFTQFHQTSARNRYPMRCIQNQRYGYIFNPWSDGERVFKNESQSGLTFKAMQAAAKTNPKIAARVKLFQYRAVEEFYDFANDPDALHNLSKDSKYKKGLDKMRKELLNWMKQTNDPALEALENRNSLEALKKFMLEQDAKSGKKKIKKKRAKKRTSQNKLLTN